MKETLALDSVPRHPYIFGIAGTLPYVATSLSTLVLSWNITATWPTKWSLVNTFMLWPENAREWLHVMEHIQLGYGAVLISFLGAVHWVRLSSSRAGYAWLPVHMWAVTNTIASYQGLELAEKTPSYPRTSTRYIASFVAPLVAWPTILMPVIYALIAQFTALTALYLFDARAAQQGWAPGWYPTYRFVLTAIVGGAIAAALIGRARIDAGISETVEDAGSAALNLKAMRERIVNPKGIEGRHGEKGRYVNWERLEEEERQRRREKEAKKKKEEEEAEKGAEEKGKEKDGDKKEVKDSGNGESKKKDGVDEKAHEKADGGSNKEKKDKESKK